jgi:hypothetical protein
MEIQPYSPSCTQLEDFEFQWEACSHQMGFCCWIECPETIKSQNVKPMKDAYNKREESVTASKNDKIPI